MVLLCCNINETLVSDFDWVQFWSNTGVALIGIFAIIFSYLQYQSGQKSEKRKEKRQDIHKKLNEFYSPFLDLRKKSDILYNRFQEKYRAADKDYSTLRHLLDGNKFTGNDDELLKEILVIGAKCEKLIHDKAGLIDDENLRTKILPNLTTHFLILRMTYEGKLSGEKERFKDLSFPRNVDDLIEKKIVKLQEELKKLN